MGAMITRPGWYTLSGAFWPPVPKPPKRIDPLLEALNCPCWPECRVPYDGPVLQGRRGEVVSR